MIQTKLLKHLYWDKINGQEVSIIKNVSPKKIVNSLTNAWYNSSTKAKSRLPGGLAVYNPPMPFLGAFFGKQKGTFRK
jgi:hypothetical protein